MQEKLKFTQLTQGYRYNSDSLLLADFALRFGVKNELLDIGAGCGIIGILLQSFIKNLKLSLLDIQEENIRLITKNLKQNNIQAELFHCDFKDFESKKKFDFLVCNPPFYRQGAYESQNPHKNISKFECFLPLKDFINKANLLLKPRGTLYFCYEAFALDKICIALENKKLKLTKICFVYTHKNKNARLVLIQAKKSVKSPCEILSPFFVYENGKLSEKMQEIHSRFKLESYDF